MTEDITLTDGTISAVNINQPNLIPYSSGENKYKWINLKTIMKNIGIDLENLKINWDDNAPVQVDETSGSINLKVDGKTIQIDNKTLKAKLKTDGGLVGTSGLSVKPGNGIQVNSDGVSAKLGKGLKIDNTGQITIDTGDGLYTGESDNLLNISYDNDTIILGSGGKLKVNTENLVSPSIAATAAEDEIPSSKAVADYYDGKFTILNEIAEGKRATYVFIDESDLLDGINKYINHLKDTTKEKAKDKNNKELSNLKIGDVFLLTKTNIPDYWLATNIDRTTLTSNNLKNYFNELEVRKIDLSNYITQDELREAEKYYDTFYIGPGYSAEPQTGVDGQTKNGILQTVCIRKNVDSSEYKFYDLCDKYDDEYKEIKETYLKKSDKLDEDASINNANSDNDDLIPTVKHIKDYYNTEQVQVDWNETNASAKAYIQNKPQIYNGNFTNVPDADKNKLITVDGLMTYLGKFWTQTEV